MLASTVDQGCSSLEAQAALSANLSVDVVNGTQWDAMGSADFASYRALVLGDPDCQTDPSLIAAADSNKYTWGPQLTGNTIIIGTDPVFHTYRGDDAPGPSDVINQGMKFATAVSGKTGAYIDLSCYYTFASAHTPVPLLNGVNTLPLPDGSTPTDTNTAFTVQDANCSDSGHITAADNAAPIGLTDADLSSWNCSVHEGFDQWPADFRVLALDEESTATYISPDGTVRGLPYILVRGAGVTAITPLTIVPPAGVSGSGDTTTDPFVVPVDSPSAAFTIKVCTLSGGCGSDPPAGNVVTLHVNSTTYTAATDSNGVATFTINPPLDGITSIFATFVDPATGNPITSDTKFYEFSLAPPSDTIPPTTSASATTGGSAYSFGAWTNQSVQVTLSASDDSGGSGVAETYYAIDNAACTPSDTSSCTTYSGSPFTVSGDGTHIVTFFSVDNAGNAEAANTATVKIGSASPTSTSAPTGGLAAPTATPTNTAVPPTATPLLPTATGTAIPPTATSTAVQPTAPPATPSSTAAAPPPVSIPLSFSVAPRSVAGGGALTVRVRTAPHAHVTVTLLALTTKTVVTGKGKHRKSVRRTVVAYQLVSRGVADAQGRLTRMLHVAYKPGKPVQAGLTVTASTANGSVTRTGHVTITPPHHSLALLVAALAHRVVSGHTLVLRLRTAARAHVAATLQVVATRIVVTGKGKHRKRVTHTVVLYHVTSRGVADAHGAFTGRLKIAYHAAKLLQATLTVTARTARGTATRRFSIVVQPRPQGH